MGMPYIADFAKKHRPNENEDAFMRDIENHQVCIHYLHITRSLGMMSIQDALRRYGIKEEKAIESLENVAKIKRNGSISLPIWGD